MYVEAATDRYAEQADLVAWSDPNDRVIVTSPDHTHADLVVAALDAGARRRLLPPLAPSQGQLRWAAGAQGIPSLRPGELVGR